MCAYIVFTIPHVSSGCLVIPMTERLKSVS